jgi:hypothetical protein
MATAAVHGHHGAIPKIGAVQAMTAASVREIAA